MMPNAKAAVLELVGKQLDDVSWEELTQKIYFRERIERGLQQIENGEHEDADAVFDELLREES